MRRVLGIDPGTFRMGFAVVEEHGNRLVPIDYGTIIAPRSEPLPARLLRLVAGVRAAIARHAPEEMALGDVFFGKSLKAAIRIGEGRAVAILGAAEHGIPVSEYPPALVKRSVATNGAAPKSQVAGMARRILGISDDALEPDASDALAIAITHLHRRRSSRQGPQEPGPSSRARTSRRSRSVRWLLERKAAG